MTNAIGKIKPFLLTLGIVVADQLSKAFIVWKWPQDGVFIKDVFGNNFLWIIHVRNKAIAFSMGNQLPAAVRAVLFIALPVVVLFFLVRYYLKTDDFTPLQRWSVAGIVGGGIGNLLDRVFRPDGVVDFISVNIYGLFGMSRWPTFNVADSSVVVCGILLFIAVVFTGERKTEVAQ